MAFLSELWLAIVVAAAAVFVASSVIHMLLPLHRGEKQRLPDEDRVRAALRAAGVKPGAYMIPCPASIQDMATPEMEARFREGPVGHLTVLPDGPLRIGRSLLHWFLYSLLVGLFTAYLARLALPGEASFLSVFRVAGTIAVLGYAVGDLQDSIWKGRPWGTTLRYVLDGLIYGLATGAAFAALWPR